MGLFNFKTRVKFSVYSLKTLNGKAVNEEETPHNVDVTLEWYLELDLRSWGIKDMNVGIDTETISVPVLMADGTEEEFKIDMQGARVSINFTAIDGAPEMIDVYMADNGQDLSSIEVS